MHRVVVTDKCTYYCGSKFQFAKDKLKIISNNEKMSKNIIIFQLIVSKQI